MLLQWLDWKLCQSFLILIGSVNASRYRKLRLLDRKLYIKIQLDTWR